MLMTRKISSDILLFFNGRYLFLLSISIIIIHILQLLGERHVKKMVSVMIILRTDVVKDNILQLEFESNPFTRVRYCSQFPHCLQV